MYWHSDAAPLPADVANWITDSQLSLERGAVKVLGVPVGPSRNVDALSAMAMNITKRNDTFFRRLASSLIPSQISFALLRLCGVPRQNHLARCARPAFAIPAHQYFDSQIYATVMAKGFVLPSEWSNTFQRLVALPLRLGGMGFRSSAATANIAWLSSVAASAAFISSAFAKFGVPVELSLPSPLALQAAGSLDIVKAGIGADALRLLPDAPSALLSFFANPASAPDCPKLQKALTKSTEEAFANRVSNHGDARTAALLKSRCEPLAHLWRDTVPSSPSLFLSDDQFALNFRTEFGLTPIPADAVTPSCGMCQVFNLARDSTHFINCEYSAMIRLRRHNEISGHLAAAWRDLHGVATLEPRKLSVNDRSRPDIDGWLGMRRYLIDVTCRNDVSCSQIGRDILAAAEQDKIAHYQDMAIALRATFVPFVTLAFGGFAPTAVDFVRRLRQFGLSRDPLLTPRDVTRLMCRKIAISIHRANADMYLAGIACSLRPLPAGALGGGLDGVL